MVQVLAAQTSDAQTLQEIIRPLTYLIENGERIDPYILKEVALKFGENRIEAWANDAEAKRERLLSSRLFKIPLIGRIFRDPGKVSQMIRLNAGNAERIVAMSLYKMFLHAQGEVFIKNPDNASAANDLKLLKGTLKAMRKPLALEDLSPSNRTQKRAVRAIVKEMQKVLAL